MQRRQYMLCVCSFPFFLFYNRSNAIVVVFWFPDFYTPVPVCRDPVLGTKTCIFVKTSLKRSFSFQTLLRDIGNSLFWKSGSVETSSFCNTCDRPVSCRNSPVLCFCCSLYSNLLFVHTVSSSVTMQSEVVRVFLH